MFYSQFGEDQVLADIFAQSGKGQCVEVGANDGRHGSTTLYFEQHGWDCVLVEPNPYLCEKLRAERQGQVFECAASDVNGSATLGLAEGAEMAHALSSISSDANTRRTVRRHGFVTRPVEVETRRLDDILDDAKMTSIDFVSIDVEGHELSVLKGFSLGRWQPKIVIVEDNRFFGNGKVQRHLKCFDYVRFHRSGVNDWYAHRTNRALVRWRRSPAYFGALIKGRAFYFRHSLAQNLKRIPGMYRLYKALSPADLLRRQPRP